LGNGREAPSFDLSIAIEWTVAAAVAVETQIAGFDPFGINQFAVTRFEVLLVGARSKSGEILVVVVEERPNMLGESRVIRSLHHHGAKQRHLKDSVVPNKDGVDRTLPLQVHLHPLHATWNLDQLISKGLFLPVGNHRELSAHWSLNACGHFLAKRQVGHPLGNQKGRWWAPGWRLDVRPDG